MKKDNNYRLEMFVEKYNGQIQGVILLITIIISCLISTNGLRTDEPHDATYLFGIIITLLTGLICEMIILQIKDSMVQRKINSLGEVVRKAAKYEEDIWKEETDLEPFFDRAQQEVFMSGIVVDKLLRKYNHKIRELLEKGIKVRILMESFEEVEEAAKFLYGQDYNSESGQFIRSRLESTLSHLEGLKSYLNTGMLEIGLATAPLVNPSIIAYDYATGHSFETRRTELSKAPEMSVRFYMQGVDGPTSELKTHPTLLINSNIMPKQYDDFVKVIHNTWCSSKCVTSVMDFEVLKKNVINKK